MAFDFGVRKQRVALSVIVREANCAGSGGRDQEGSDNRVFLHPRASGAHAGYLIFSDNLGLRVSRSNGPVSWTSSQAPFPFIRWQHWQRRGASNRIRWAWSINAHRESEVLRRVILSDGTDEVCKRAVIVQERR